MSSLLGATKVLAIQLFFGLTFFLAASLKWRLGVTPEFWQQFGGTWLAHLPGGLPAVYYLLALLETVAVLGILFSLWRGEFLPATKKIFLKLTLVFSPFIFTVLAFGSD